jgi:hypothetical protein
MDPYTIAGGALGLSFLQEGVKFLWSEAAKLLDRYHKRKENERAIVLNDPAPAALQFPATRSADVARVGGQVAELERLTKELSLYGIGARPVDASDDELLLHADQLRALLAALYELPPGLPTIRSRVSVGTVEEGGEVTGVRAADGVAQPVDSIVQADQVRGTVTGVDLTKR